MASDAAADGCRDGGIDGLRGSGACPARRAPAPGRGSRPRSGIPMSRLWLLALAVTVGQLANSMILPALPLLARDLSVPASSAGLIVTVYFAGFALAEPVVGPLSDRFGRRPLLLGGLAMLAAGSVACAFAASLSALLLFRLLQAAGAAGPPV